MLMLKVVIFIAKQRSPKKINLRVNYYLLLNTLQKAMHFASFSPGPRQLQIYPKKMTRFKP